jgi:N-sulfoglucosamine sulfohydrolase
MSIMRSLSLALTLIPLLAYGQDRPNILLLMAEDLSPRIGAFGDAAAITPNIDQLAAKGVSYTHVFTAAGVCAPSRAALIMGMHQQSFGAQHMRSYTGAPAAYRPVPPVGAKAFPELLRAAGYYTFVTTKLDYQFSGPWTGSGPFSIWDRNERLGGYETPPNKPFFGYITYMETHESGLVPRWTWPASISHLMAQIMHVWLHRDTQDQIFADDVVVPPYYPDTQPIRGDIARHYNNVITMDRKVGEILERLEADGLADETIVIWTTDHGDALPRAKRELYDSGLLVPMIIHWPEKYRPSQALPGTTEDRLVSFVDLAPTLLSMAGVDIPDNIQGQAFSGSAETPPRDYVFAARDRIGPVPDMQRAVRDRQYKYIYSHNTQAGGFRLAYRDMMLGMQDLWHSLAGGELDDVQMQWFSERPKEMLFDTVADPSEINNLAENPDYRQELERMRTALASHESNVYDYSAEMSEIEMAESFWPGGQQPTTASPTFNLDDVGNVVMTSNTNGASIGYRLNEASWLLYTHPILLESGEKLQAKAVRYGWAISEVSDFSR